MGIAFKNSDNCSAESFKIIEVGVQLSEQEKSYVNQRIQDIAFDAPSDAFIELKFINEWEQVRATMNINSKRVKFNSEFVGISPLEVFSFLESEIRAKIDVWKSKRVFRASDVKIDLMDWKSFKSNNDRT